MYNYLERSPDPRVQKWIAWQEEMVGQIRLSEHSIMIHRRCTPYFGDGMGVKYREKNSRVGLTHGGETQEGSEECSAEAAIEAQEGVSSRTVEEVRGRLFTSACRRSAVQAVQSRRR